MLNIQSNKLSRLQTNTITKSHLWLPSSTAKGGVKNDRPTAVYLKVYKMEYIKYEA